MTMQPRPLNPIEKKKQDVRRYSRNGVISVAAGAGVGVLSFLFLSTNVFVCLAIALIIAVVGGGYNFLKVQKIINENHNQY